MKVFVDAKILVSVLNKEYPLFTHSARILSLPGNRQFKIYTSPICLAIAFYFAEKNIKQNLQMKRLLYYVSTFLLQMQHTMFFS